MTFSYALSCSLKQSCGQSNCGAVSVSLFLLTAKPLCNMFVKDKGHVDSDVRSKVAHTALKL